MLLRKGAGAACGALVVLALVAGIGLRAVEVSRARLWIDEYLVLEIGSAPTPGAIVARLEHEANPPLYFLLAHAILKTTHDAELPLRLLSALASTLTAILAAAAAWRRWGPASAAVAALLVSLSAIAVHYGAEIRPFALLGLVTVLYLLVLDHAISRPTAGWLAAEALLIVLATSLHAYGAPLLFVGPAVALVTGRRKALGRQALVSAAAAAVAVPSVLVPLWRLPPETNEYLVEIWRNQSPLAPAGLLLRDLLPTASWPSSVDLPPDRMLRAATGAAVALAAGLVAVALAATRSRPEPWRPGILAVSAWVLIAGNAVMAVIFALGGRQVVAPGRFSVPLVAPLALGVAAIVGAAPAGRLITAGLGALAIVSALHRIVQPPVSGIRPEALDAEILRRSIRGPALVMTVGLSGIPLRYAFRDRSDVEFRSYPSDIDQHIGWWAPKSYLGRLDSLRPESEALAREAASRASGGWQVFLEGARHPIAAPLCVALSAYFRPRPLNRLSEGLVELLPAVAAGPSPP
ncbi:MAG: glycosyltransferase family 39 protein [Acidithiobacillales bacterium]